MSRLTRKDKDSPQSNKSSSPQALTGDTVISHLKKCQSIAGNYAQEFFQGYCKRFDEALNEKTEKAKSNHEMTELMGVQRLARRNRQELERYYCGYLAEGFVKFKKKNLHTELQGGDEEKQSEGLSLVGNEDLEETIILSSMVQKLDTFYAEPIWALNQRFAILNGGERVTEAGNPATPIQLCESLRKALRLVPMPASVKAIAYSTFEKGLSELVKNIVEDINSYLKSVDILPHLKYMPAASSKPGGTASRPEPQRCPTGINDLVPPRYDQDMNVIAAPDPNLPTGQYQSALIQSIRALQSNLAGGAPMLGRRATDTVQTGAEAAAQGLNAFIPSTGASASSDVYISSDQLLSALQNVQNNNSGVISAQSGSGELVPIDIQQILMALGQQVQQGPSGDNNKVSESDMHTIDLVGLVFEFMLKDENLPDSVKAILSYLHTPFLKLAFNDPGFFEQTEHPARMLLNGLAEAGVRWVGNDGSVQHDIYNRIKEAVDRVLKEFENDTRVIAEVLLEFNSYTKNIIRRQELMEKRAAEKAQGEERLREVKIRVNEEVRSRTDNQELPSAVLLFVLQPWSDYLSFVLLRYGDTSDKWESALKLVDDLMWAIKPMSEDTDLEQHKTVTNGLLTEAEQGFETIGYDQAKGSKLLEAISSLLAQVQQDEKAEPAPAPMRDKLEKIAAEKAGQIHSYDRDISEEEKKIVENLKMIEFGTWFEFEGGKRQKIAWYNARTSHYMLVDQMGKKVAMISGIDIARQMIQKKAKIIAGSSKPFFERALENIFQKLNAQAEAQMDGQPTDTDQVEGE